MSEKVGKFERSVHWRPAFDKRSSDPKKNYGVHGLELQFRLKGPEGGITFLIFTNWMLPHVQAETDAKPLTGRNPWLFHKPMPAGVDGHWKTPQYIEQRAIQCCELTGGDCYSDGSALLSNDLFDLLVAKGDQAVWKRLEELYEVWRPKATKSLTNALEEDVPQ